MHICLSRELSCLRRAFDGWSFPTSQFFRPIRALGLKEYTCSISWLDVVNVESTRLCLSCLFLNVFVVLLTRATF